MSDCLLVWPPLAAALAAKAPRLGRPLAFLLISRLARPPHAFLPPTPPPPHPHPPTAQCDWPVSLVWAAGQSASTRQSWLRDSMPSLMKTFFRWYWTVRALRNNRAPISGLDRPSRANRAIWDSCT